MPLRPAVVALSFAPAGLGLLHQGIHALAWPHQLLALAMVLLVIEQAHMARVDLQRAVRVAATYPSQARRFGRVLGATIAIEWVGFAWAALGALGLGANLVVVALLGFNLASNMSFEGDRLYLAGPRDRWDVILADLVGLALLGLWQLPMAQPWVGSGALGLMGLYWGIKGIKKLNVLLSSRWRSASAVQVAHPTQQHPQPSHQNS